MQTKKTDEYNFLKERIMKSSLWPTIPDKIQRRITERIKKLEKEEPVRSREEIKRKIGMITKLSGQGVLGRVKSPRAHSKIMALEWVINERGELY